MRKGEQVNEESLCTESIFYNEGPRNSMKLILRTDFPTVIVLFFLVCVQKFNSEEFFGKTDVINNDSEESQTTIPSTLIN